MTEENVHPSGPCHPSSPCEDPECQICCDHQEHDHGFCLACGTDITDTLIRDAEDYYEWWDS